jgi:hypothetical protein
MLRAGIRQAEIARRLDLAVGTISRIASVRRLRRLKLHLLAADELPEDDPPPDYVAANLRRCPGCGGLVYQWPCLACRLRAEHKAPTIGRGDEPVDVPPYEAIDDGRVNSPNTLTTGQGFDHIAATIGREFAADCAPKGQPAIAQAAGLGSRLAHQHSAPTGRAEWTTTDRGQRAPLGLNDASSAEIELHPPTYPGLRPGLSQVGPSGRNLRPLIFHSSPTDH